MLWLKALAVWLVILAAMFGNAAVREGFFKPRVGELRANQISAGTGIVLLLAITAALWRWMGIKTAGATWGVGVLWLGLTLAFEFGVGHFVLGDSWEKLLGDYNVLRGRLWPALLAMTLLGPWVVRWWRGS